MRDTVPPSVPAYPAHAARPGPRMLAWGLAFAMAILLSVVWAIVDWPQLSVLRLPDSDDMMRLTEIRDWVAGQDFHDLVQHRLGLPPGASMHWSRIADAGPALLLIALRPLIGQAQATIAMVILYQAILLFAYLTLSARNARLLIGERAMPYAVILAALAFPTQSLLLPGRIDHHGLQIVLMLIVLGAMVAPPTWRNGVTGGVAAGLSLAVGLEVAPELVGTFAALGLLWLVWGGVETPRLGGFGIGLAGVTLVLLLFARPQIWPAEWCDGFTPASTSATMIAGAAMIVLAVVGRRSTGVSSRIGWAVLAAAIAGGATLHTSPVCLAGPYGALDPFLKRAFMDNVSEARGMFVGQDSVGASIAYGGLCLASLLAVALVLRDPARRARWWPFALLLAVCVVAAILQIRVTYIVAGIATLPFAALIVDMSDDPRHVGRRLLIWLTGSGIAYAVLGMQLERVMAPASLGVAQRAARACIVPEPLRMLASLPPGNVMAPMDSGAYVIGMTPHRSFAAGYHRNNAGNMAMYRFFLASPAAARRIAGRLDVTYVVTCENSLWEGALTRARRGSLIEALQTGHVPRWLQPIRTGEGGFSIYRVR